MSRNLVILGVLALIVAVPFIFQRPPPQGDWRTGDPVIVIVSPHTEAIRYEFAQAFSRWHQKHFKRADGTGQPVKIDWRNIGGTSEISRYLASEYSAAARAWVRDQPTPPKKSPDDLLKPPARDAPQEDIDLYNKLDDPAMITSKVDLFFGGGEFDHSNAFTNGYTMRVADRLDPALFKADGVDMIPERVSGEIWRSPAVIGNVVSTFGIIYNIDRLRDLGISTPPTQWADLTAYKYRGQVGLADPTKSGSIAKAFEIIVHQQMHEAAKRAGYTDERIAANEKQIDEYRAKIPRETYRRGDVPAELKPYQAELEKGFDNGLYLIQQIGANARYFTDSASKVPIDVSMGDAAIGMAIDFYGRYQAQTSRAPDGTERMRFVTPIGGTSVSCDPISLLRGSGGSADSADQRAYTREVAIRFIQFAISEDGQRLWCYEPGTKDAAGELIGPEKYALRRLPIRRTFYPSTQPAIQAAHEEHKKHSIDKLDDPTIDPYAVARQFVYYKRWTGDHFSVLRDIVRAMCMDSGDELKAAWVKIRASSDAPPIGPAFGPLPTITLADRKDRSKTVQLPLDWKTSPEIRRNFESIEYMREWTKAFRDQYKQVADGKTFARSGNP